MYSPTLVYFTPLVIPGYMLWKKSLLCYVNEMFTLVIEPLHTSVLVEDYSWEPLF